LNKRLAAKVQEQDVELKRIKTALGGAADDRDVGFVRSWALREDDELARRSSRRRRRRNFRS